MRKYLAELIGTYALVFCGTGAIIINEQAAGVITHLGISITFGLIVMSMIYTLGDVSGAHINPAVSIAFTIAGRFPVKFLPFYLLSQISGAILASLTLKGLFPDNLLLGTTLPAGSQWQSLTMEFILTFFLMLVIFRVSTGSKELGMVAGLAIGSVVGLEAMFAGPISGASMNPARSLGPAIVSGQFSSLWVYLLSPVAGAMAAVPVFNLLKPESNASGHETL